MSAILDQIEPLKAEAVQALQSAPDLPSLENTKGAFLGPEGRFTALMKQLGSLPQGGTPRRRQGINAAKVELEAASVASAARPRTWPRCPLSPPISLCPDAGAEILADCIRSPKSRTTSCGVPQDWGSPSPTVRRSRTNAIASMRQHAGRSSGARFTGHLLPRHPRAPAAAHAHQFRADPRDGNPAAADSHHRPGRVYRRDNADATHNPTFHQVEGLYVDKG
jgi:phenylalanyl-tRNA synthetase alpha chain